MLIMCFMNNSKIITRFNGMSQSFRNILSMRKICLFYILLLFCISVRSQINVKVGIATNFPTGTMKDYYKSSPGVDVNAKYLIANKLGIGISSGFQHFYTKDWGLDYTDISFNIIPIRASLNYYFWTHRFKPYLGFEFGLNLTDLKYTYNYYDIYKGYNTLLHRDYFHTLFGAAPVAGFQINIGSSFALDLNSKLNYLSKASIETPSQIAKYVGVNAGMIYRFGGKTQALPK